MQEMAAEGVALHQKPAWNCLREAALMGLAPIEVHNAKAKKLAAPWKQSSAHP